MSILKSGQHTVLGGIAGQYQSGIARELVFGEVVSERRPVAIFLVDTPDDDAPLKQFNLWRKARGKPNSGEGRIYVTDALARARNADDFIKALDKLWGYTPSPLIVRDTAHATFQPDRWLDYAPEVARIYRAKVLTVVNTGVHDLIAKPLRSIGPADAWFECRENEMHVTVKNVADPQEAVKFIGRLTHGCMVFDAKEKELV